MPENIGLSSLRTSPGISERVMWPSAEKEGITMAVGSGEKTGSLFGSAQSTLHAAVFISSGSKISFCTKSPNDMPDTTSTTRAPCTCACE